MSEPQEELRAYYRRLSSAWGPQHWWPAQSRFEVIVGAYLTQNTSWNNVERALRNLRAARILSVDGIRRAPLPKLESLIRPAGYFRQKATRLKNFVQFLDSQYAGSLTRMFAEPTAELRQELLGLNGVGPETADSILLYAGNHPVFVVDAYSRRILERHRVVGPGAGYEEIRALFEEALASVEYGPKRDAPVTANGEARGSCHRPSRMSRATRTPTAQLFNEMHALIVGVGKAFCQKSQMRCELCPLQRFLQGQS